MAANLIDGWIIPRAGWETDESLRFQNGAEIWTPEYRPIQKVIIHHTVTQNQKADPAATMRASITTMPSPRAGAISATTSWSTGTAMSTKDATAARTSLAGTRSNITMGVSRHRDSGYL